MEFTFKKLPITPGMPKMLVDIIPREHAAEIWYVAFSPLLSEVPTDWRVTRRELKVAVPVFAYAVNSNPADLGGYAMQLGMQAMQDMRQQDVRRVHITFGDKVCERETDTGTIWEFRVGVGVLVSQ